MHPPALSPASSGGKALPSETNKELVRRLVDEVVNRRNPGALDDIAEGQFAKLARRWVSPFRSSFPDFRMEIVELVAEDDMVVGHFKCSADGRHPLYYQHRVDPETPLEDSLATIKEYWDSGKIRHVGLSEVGID
jgi:hypothetical protein